MLRRMALKLYGHDTSPYVRRIRVLLAEKGLPFERDTDGWSVATAEVLRINPMLRVPAMADIDPSRHAGQAQYLLDSKIIAAYLYDRYPQAPPPPPPGAMPLQSTMYHLKHRYDDENALFCIDAATDSAINVFLLELDGISRDRSPYLQRQMERIGSCLSWLDALLASRPTLHEGSFSYFDIAMVCALEWMLFRQRYPVLDHPHLAQFLERHANRPTLAATHPRHAANAGPPRISR